MLRSIENINHDKRPISDSLIQSPKKRQKIETDNCQTVTAEIMLPSTILTEETSFSQIVLNEKVKELYEPFLTEKKCDNNNNDYVQDDQFFHMNKQAIESPCEPQSSTQKDLETLAENNGNNNLFDDLFLQSLDIYHYLKANNERSCIDNFVEKNIISQIYKEENKTESETNLEKNTLKLQANILINSTQKPENLINRKEKNIRQTEEHNESNSAEEEDEESSLSTRQEKSSSTDEQEEQSSHEEHKINLIYGGVDLLNLPGCSKLCLSKPTRYGCALARYLWSKSELANNRIVDPKSEQFNMNRARVRPAYRKQIDLFKINLIKETIRIKFNLTGNNFLSIWEDVCKSINSAR